MSQTMNSRKVPRTPPVETNRNPYEMTSGVTGSISKVISQRRSNRQHGRVFECVFMITLDIGLLVFAFYLAHFLRYNVLNGTDFLSTTASAITGEKINQFQERRFSQSIPLITTFVML